MIILIDIIIQTEISSIESCDAHAGVVWATTGDVFASNYPITAIEGFRVKSI